MHLILCSPRNSKTTHEKLTGVNAGSGRPWAGRGQQEGGGVYTLISYWPARVEYFTHLVVS